MSQNQTIPPEPAPVKLTAPVKPPAPVKLKRKNRLGRPKKTKCDIDAAVAQALAEKGFTDAEIAKLYDVDEHTVNTWKKQYPLFYQSLKTGKALADSGVEASLYQRARGYSHPDLDIRVCDGRLVQTPIIKHYPPDPTSMIFWLKNRKRDEWCDRIENNLNMVVSQGAANDEAYLSRMKTKAAISSPVNNNEWQAFEE